MTEKYEICKRVRSGITLIQVLIVIGVVVIVSGLLLIGIQQNRSVDGLKKCQNNEQRVALGLRNYHDTYGTLPIKKGQENGLSWMAHLLPYIGEDDLCKQALDSLQACPIDNKNHQNSTSHPALGAVVNAYICPDDTHIFTPAQLDGYGFVAKASYLGVSGSRQGDFKPGCLNNDVGISLSSITDGLSNTLLLGERPPPQYEGVGQWYSVRWSLKGPNGVMSIPETIEKGDNQCSQSTAEYGPGNLNNPCDRYHFWSQHGGGANFAFADGSVRFIPYSAKKTLFALASRAGGEVVELP